MNRYLGLAAFMTGLSVVCWIAFGYIHANPLALLMTLLIAAFYAMGALELHRFHHATAQLAAALAAVAAPLPNLAGWLQQLPGSLQNPVRLRIEGERLALPGPAMTPYLVGLLVLLGMLGTFLGMVVTLKGAVLALESTTDLATIRAALAAPVKGLGLAFGTSVAGVAASGMLGLLSALCRRERLQAAQALDANIATRLRVFSLAHQREETLKALQSQAAVMPEVVDRLQRMMAQLERQSEALNDRLLAGQDGFYRDAKTVYADLAVSVEQSLQTSLSASARVAGATIQPVVEATMAAIARQTTQLHHSMASTVQQQLEALSARLGSAVSTALSTAVNTAADAWASGLARHERSSEDLSRDLRASLVAFSATFEQRSASLLLTVDQAHAARQAALALQDEQRLAAWTQSLGATAASLQQHWQHAGAHNLRQQEQLCKTLEQTAQAIHSQTETQTRATLAEVAGLLQAAAVAPQAAAEVMGQLRQQLADSLVRDNAVLEERNRLTATLAALLSTVNDAATEQRSAIDALVVSSAAVLQQVGKQFSDRVEAGSATLSAVAAQLTGSAVEVASLGETFGFAVQLFSESSDALVANLQRIEGALNKSTTRSDEQLAYYVAQAREVIDLSLLSQKQIVEDLQQLARRPLPLASEVA